MSVNAKPVSAGDDESLSKAARLKAMIQSPGLEFLMEAHDGLSAKIVEEAGFKGIWASGLSVSAALGVRDNNEASWTQVLDVLEFMTDASSIPILVDGDTGYGNFNNFRRVVRKMCQRDVAGVCIEDKLFPKTNSFIGEGQPLADIDEFTGKIKAGKDSQTDPDFCLVARIEALIAGWGLDEALRRAEAYHQAGADALLIHSKKAVADEVLAFKAEWGDRCPVVIVPTKYFDTPTDKFREAGISVVIWANHNLRASITAMRDVSRRILREETLAGIEGGIISVKDIFEITGDDELAEAEKRYLPSKGDQPRAILLAASRGSKLGDLTKDHPKCMIDVRGQPLLRRLVETFNEGGVRDITVVRGYKKDVINLPSIKTIDNDVFASTNEVASLACAADDIQEECLIAYGDILFRHYILDRIRAAPGDIVLAVDAMWEQRQSDDKDWVRDLVSCSQNFSTGYLDEEHASLTNIGPGLRGDEIQGEWIGLAKLTAEGSKMVRAKMEALRKDGGLQKASMVDLFAGMLEDGCDISVIYVTGHWLDVDNMADLAKAGEFL
ncbi:MAG TPA: phosphoenolpyruvate mutase [Rhodospirillales bacterium]|nr:phosphoenolpyruvate mutase [Rhodospirillales bacterium]